MTEAEATTMSIAVPEMPKKGDTGFFFAGFRYIGLYNKNIGSCFLGGLSTDDWTKVYSIQQSWFTVFTAVVTLASIGLGMAGMVEYEHCSRELSDAAFFHAYAYVFYVACVIIESVVNYITAIVRAPRLLGLIVQCSRMERLLTAPAGSKRRMRLYAAGCLAYNFFLMTTCLALGYVTDFGSVMLHGKASSLMKIYARILGVVYIAVLLPTCLCPRICLSYFFSVFNFYIGCIGQEIKACLGSTHMDTASKLEVVEQCRSLLHSIRSWVRETAVILGPGLLYTYGYAAGLFCASVVYCILPGVKPLIKFFFLGSGVMHFVSLLVPTVIAHRFAYKVWRLQTDISCIYLGKEDPKLARQVLMLLNTLKQEDYLFNVNSYFNVNLETFTSIIGAALMYTVFLVQTTKPLVEEDSNP